MRGIAATRRWASLLRGRGEQHGDYGSATGGKVPQSEFTYRSRDGLTLFGRAWGDPAAPGLPVVCLPGMTRNSKDFAPLAEHLARTRRVIALDLRGRGRSAYAAVATYNPGTRRTT